jgi:hypothetical protein
MSPGTTLGFFWALGGIRCTDEISFHLLTDSMAASAERRELYRFSVDLAKLALRIAERHGSSGEKWRGHRYSMCSVL